MFMKQKTNDLEFIVLIALLMALVALAINTLLPAFSAITSTFKLKDKTTVQLSISLLYLGMALGQFLFGGLSDSYGRKKAMHWGLTLFVLGGFLSAFSISFWTLIVGQILQGVGLGAPRVVTTAIVRDRYEGSQMGRIVSFSMVIFMLIPILAPYLGQQLLLLSSWRLIFGCNLFFTLILWLWFQYRIPESHPISKRILFRPKQLAGSLLHVLQNKTSVVYTLILGVYSSVYIAYLNLSQQIFEVHYDLGKQYPFYFALLAIGIAVSSFINGKVVVRFGMKTIVSFALWTGVLFSFLPLTLHYTMGSVSFHVFFAFMLVQLFCFGLLIGNLTALAMKPLGKIAGIGAASIGAISTLIAVPFSIFIGNLYHDSILPIAIGFTLVGIISLLLIHFSIQLKNLTNNKLQSVKKII